MSDFTQVVVWPNANVSESTPEQIEQFILEHLKSRIKFIGEITTGPDYDDPDSGGRNDLLFYIHSEDIPLFAVPRLMYGLRWLEDVLDNEERRNSENGVPEDYSIYPEEVRKLYSWK